MDQQEDYTSDLQLELEEEEDDNQLSQLAELDVQLSLSLACGSTTAMSSSGDEEDAEPRRRRRDEEAAAAAFECRTCGRRFPSHQALGRPPGPVTSGPLPTSGGPARPSL
ncbi:hypothetical protein OsJ_34842 [Oryza sativa Japonica Group]|uniref:Uncharacterized protein n=1 Tax=Oryza sativa subsp. japonica TaxID=39947 RepID=A3CDY6_ORYSJ|nr:hypothetical protein OsJ_34842 [Oryza sativa Japonica Group]